MSLVFLAVLADELAEKIRSGTLGATLPDLTLDVVTLDGAPEALFDLLEAEGGKKRRNEERCTALLMLIGGALGELRMGVQAEQGGQAALTLMGLLERLVEAAEDGTLPPDLLLGLAQQFNAARLPLPDEVRDLIVAAARAPMEGVPAPTPEAIAADFAQLAEAMDHDPFLIHEQLGEQFALFPDDLRRTAIGALIDSDVPAMGEAALGWLLDPDPDVARAVAERLAAAAGRGRVSAASADRLVRMRPWLPEPVQEPVAAAIKACRERGLSPRPAEAAGPARSVRFIATGVDGGGAQSLFALVDGADGHVFAALLMKHGHGLRETVLQDDVGPEGAAQFLDGIARNIDCFDTSPGFARDLIAHGLATGLSAGEPPPFELLRFLDLVGLPPIAPARLEPGQIVAQLLDGLPEERRSDGATNTALAASGTWAKAYHFPESWFEPDGIKVTVATLTAGRKRQGAVLSRIVEPQRAYFGELLAWIAKAAQGAAEAGAPAKVGRGRRKMPAAEAWIDLALVARAFLDETPIDEIPLAAEIARQTLAVQRRG
ncbi:hypothetical protein [Methylobacterium sp. 174MFSha1.1]|uniref:hypothetical protein n=1 Tax=Methylobacterium sp. 174MFSha1.1 TaxID=1502749 RepID=UPI000B839D17|nr:hypothetical protein [Methylobacterium sp. 174MFSha1.1]